MDPTAWDYVTTLRGAVSPWSDDMWGPLDELD